MRQDHVVRRSIRLRRGRLPAARRVLARRVAQDRRAPGLVEGAPVPHSIAELLKARGCKVLEIVHHLVAEPAAVLVLQALRQIPVVEGHHRDDLAGNQLVEQGSIELDRLRVGPSPSRGQQAGPGDGEAVRRQAELLHEPHVLPEAVVVVARHGACLVLRNLPRRLREGVPDAGRTAALGRCALDLVGGCRAAPEEVVRELQRLDGGNDVQQHQAAADLLGVKEAHEAVVGLPP
mmetsp:Transcript_100288/g.279348  ORF Transcript_100288/g.279348 Transcript_100288/m.279348 type:complete len:234 (+) Transcript_100288:703-1404(+)